MIRVLVVDDDRHMRSACSRVLSKEGWLVICAETGDKGLEEIVRGAGNIDVILLDDLMPGMSGMEVLARIRAIDPNLPVVIMTGSVTEESALETVRKGAYDCLAKPFTPAQLRDVIRKAAKSRALHST
jgi:DNA-binding NtrC family response regulator